MSANVSKPRILVMTAAGKTGMPVALHLLSEGFPVTAFVRQVDHRSARLKAQGADIFVGSVSDIDDMKQAMKGAQRAYFNAPTPMKQGTLKIASIFTTVAAEQKIESVVAMSQWLANPNHPSVHTREVWLADRLLALLPDTDVTTINVGFFADNDMQSMAFTAQFGLLMLPYGAGLNAPPSNEDIAAVIAEILARPGGHAGMTYRPTGPKLISPQDMAETFSKVFGRKIRYINAPLGTMAKVMKGMGFPDFPIAQTIEYYRDYQRGAFAIGAPTDVVRAVTGKDAEDFETIARRYVTSMPDTKRSFRTQLRLMAQMPFWMLRPGPKMVSQLAKDEFSSETHISLSADSAEWRQSHEQWPEAITLSASQSDERRPLLTPLNLGA